MIMFGRVTDRHREAVTKVLKRAKNPLYAEDLVRRTRLKDASVAKILSALEREGVVEQFAVWQMRPAEASAGGKR